MEYPVLKGANMSCDLHEIGASVRMARRLDLEFPDGKRVTLSAGEVGVVRGIDKSRHMVDVYFKIVDKTLTLLADEVVPWKK